MFKPKFGMKKEGFKKDRDEKDEKKGKEKKFFRKKICKHCAEKLPDLDYKDVPRLQKFVTERGKIMPSRISGNCARHQRQLQTAVKRARFVALLPYAAG